MIPIKSKEDLKMLKKSGKILAEIMQRLKSSVKAGVSTLEIDELAQKLVDKEKALPAFKGYKGFPGNICASINEEVVHGIPGPRRLKEGDIIGLDLGINYKGYFCDGAITVGVGRLASGTDRLIAVTKNALLKGIERARVNNRLSDISYAIQTYVEKHGFSVVRQFVGHGIGHSLHETPEIPNFGRPHEGELLKNGMVFAIEPMVNMGTWECEILDNGWTAVTKDGMPSAHFEHTVAITDDGPQVLTD
ncbi:MAG: type I methionyl aminopeptidase [Candidatus Omnitrophica bacterium]|nr:type I methionyl aminopeptidase [Candidatus Omnitrophota bacterium]MDD5591773.1 type I methionyl aminopeptidase [Candidatus Omnitrophota bacterium]